MAWHVPDLSFENLAITVLAAAIVALCRTLLLSLASPDAAGEHGAREDAALAAQAAEQEGDSQRAGPLAHKRPPQIPPREPDLKQWPADVRAALAARAVEERAGEPAAAAPAAPPARADSSAPGTSPSSTSTRPPRQTLQPHRSYVPIPRQPDDALLVLKRATHRRLDERYAMRDRGKLQSPVDPYDADSLCALRTEIEDKLASDLDTRRRRARRAGV